MRPILGKLPVVCMFLLVVVGLTSLAQRQTEKERRNAEGKRRFEIEQLVGDPDAFIEINGQVVGSIPSMPKGDYIEIGDGIRIAKKGDRDYVALKEKFIKKHLDNK